MATQVGSGVFIRGHSHAPSTAPKILGPLLKPTPFDFHAERQNLAQYNTSQEGRVLGSAKPLHIAKMRRGAVCQYFFQSIFINT